MLHRSDCNPIPSESVESKGYRYTLGNHVNDLSFGFDIYISYQAWQVNDLSFVFDIFSSVEDSARLICFGVFQFTVLLPKRIRLPVVNIRAEWPAHSESEKATSGPSISQRRNPKLFVPLRYRGTLIRATMCFWFGSEACRHR